MSPIIYTRHRCTPADDPEVQDMQPEDLEGATWQCPECDAYWEPAITRAYTGSMLGCHWKCTGRPREMAHVREVEAALDGSTPTQPEPPATPAVTPDMVQLVLDTHAEHKNFVICGGSWFCAECDIPVHPYGLTSEAHARNMAAVVLEDVLAKAGRDAQE